MYSLPYVVLFGSSVWVMRFADDGLRRLQYWFALSAILELLTRQGFLQWFISILGFMVWLFNYTWHYSMHTFVSSSRFMVLLLYMFWGGFNSVVVVKCFASSGVYKYFCCCSFCTIKCLQIPWSMFHSHGLLFGKEPMLFGKEPVRNSN